MLFSQIIRVNFTISSCLGNGYVKVHLFERNLSSSYWIILEKNADIPRKLIESRGKNSLADVERSFCSILISLCKHTYTDTFNPRSYSSLLAKKHLWKYFQGISFLFLDFYLTFKKKKQTILAKK